LPRPPQYLLKMPATSGKMTRVWQQRNCLVRLLPPNCCYPGH